VSRAVTVAVGIILFAFSFATPALADEGWVIERFATDITGMAIGEYDVFDEELFDHCPTLRGVLLPEHFMKITLQQRFDGG